MSLTPIFKTNPRTHIYDPFMDIWDPFINEPTIFAPQFPFHDNNMISSRIEWQETPEAHLLRAELPGLKKEDLKVTVEEGKVLKISGKKEVKKEEKRENWEHFERSKETFSNAFSLPENCKHDQVKSTMENGVLIVTVPKRDVKKSHVRNIQVEG